MLFTSGLERIGSQFLMILLTADLETLNFLAILVMGGFGTVECNTIISLFVSQEIVLHFCDILRL